MDIIISHGSQKPIYEQIYEQIVIAIATGSLKANDCLPSMRYLAKELNVSVITTQKTYEKLEADGFSYTIPGKGCFVSERPHTQENDRLSLAGAKLAEHIPYLKSLGVTLDEAKTLIEKEWNK